MAQVHSKDTTPEMAVRRAVHAAGHRYQLHRADLPGKPDLVFPRYRLAVFVHGCFWHWHGCKRSRMPADNNAYWTAKIERNRRRDEAHRAALEALGWRWRIIWECEVKEATDRLLRELSQGRDVLAAGRPAADTDATFAALVQRLAEREPADDITDAAIDAEIVAVRHAGSDGPGS
jgi:DNA mismatch endonuclease (patch repair protein)